MCVATKKLPSDKFKESFETYLIMQLSFNYKSIYVTGPGKTGLVGTFSVMRKTDLKY